MQIIFAIKNVVKYKAKQMVETRQGTHCHHHKSACINNSVLAQIEYNATMKNLSHKIFQNSKIIKFNLSMKKAACLLNI